PLQGDLRQVTPAEVQWAERVTAAPGAAGMGSTPAPLGAIPEPGQTVTFSPVYFPGTTDAASATSVTVGPGEERSGIDLAVQLVPTARLSGTVLDPSGQPPQSAQLQLQSSETNSMDIVSAVLGQLGGVRAGADGKFSMNGVTPGRYTLLVKGQPKPEGA